MNEITLIIAIILLLIFPRLLLNKVKQPFNKYIKIGCGGLLLLLIWLDPSNNIVWPKIMISVLVFFNIYKLITDFKAERE